MGRQEFIVSLMKSFSLITIQQIVTKISLGTVILPATAQIIGLIQNCINNRVKLWHKTFLVFTSAVGLSLGLPFLVQYLMASVLLEKKMGVAASHQCPMPFARRSVTFVIEFLPLCC